MKKILLIAAALLAGATAFAQNAEGASDDIGRLSLRAMIAPNSELPVNTHKMMMNKLNQIATANGIGGMGLGTRFILTANVVVIDSEVTPTAPPMTALVLSPTLYIGDIETGNLFASVTLNNVKSAGATTDKAYMAALKNIKPTSPEIQAFIEKGKVRIIEYYNSQIDFLIKEAETLASSDRFDDAICTLLQVPDVCKDAYMKAMDKVGDIYQQKIDKESAVALAAAKNAWNANQSWDGAQDAAYYLNQVDPYSSSAKAAEALGTQIAKRIREVDKREWDFEVKKLDAQISIEKARIEASRAIGIARAKQPVNYYQRVGWW